MVTNTGEQKIQYCVKLLVMKNDLLLDEESIANIISFSELIKEHRVTYNSSVLDSCHCHSNTRIVEFKRSDEGLYSVELPKGYREAVKEYDGDVNQKKV